MPKIEISEVSYFVEIGVKGRYKIIELTDLERQAAKILVTAVINYAENAVIAYSDLASRLVPPVNPHTELPEIIGNVSIKCYELGLPLLSANVTYKGSSAVGSGFYDLYCDLHPGMKQKNRKNQDEVWIGEMKKIATHNDWNPLLDYLDESENEQKPTVLKFKKILRPIRPLAKPVPSIEQTYPDEINESDVQVEGAMKRITVNSYERNPAARQKCIDKYKSVCYICGFDAAITYGTEFTGKIHVHHLTPISTIKEQYEIDGERDLRPVCPNCHMILHSKKDEDGIYAMDEVKEMIERQKAKR